MASLKNSTVSTYYDGSFSEEIDIDDIIEARASVMKDDSGNVSLFEASFALDAATEHVSNSQVSFSGAPASHGADDGLPGLVGMERAKNKEANLLPMANPDPNSARDSQNETPRVSRARSSRRGRNTSRRSERKVLLSPAFDAHVEGSENDYDAEIPQDLSYYDGDDYDAEMDESHLRLKKRLSLMERMQSKFLTGPDESKEKLLPQDTFSMMIISETWSLPYVASLCIFALQVSTFVLVLLDLAAEGSPGNVFGVPANVQAQLRATQFIAILVAVLTQGDLRTASILMRDGFTKDFDTAFMDTTKRKYYVSIAARAASGSIGLMVSFVLIITAPSVVELILNFTAVEFVSSIDELCFYLSKQGFLGSQCKGYAMNIADTMYKVSPESRQGFIRKSWKTLSLILLLIAFLVGWCIIVSFQITGRYLCNTIMVQMGDDFLASLGTFNGLYDLQFTPFNDKRVKYVERRAEEIITEGQGVFGYCYDIKSWTFRWETDDTSNYDPCDWVARSAETNTFDIIDTMGEPWLVQDNTNREVVLDPFSLTCFDCDADDGDECGGKGSCSNAVCECEDSWYGLRCEFPTPCSRLAIDARTEEFASTRDWSSDYETIELEDGSLVGAYDRPVFVHPYNNGAYDVVMFTGRRWALTSSEFLPMNGKMTDEALREMSDHEPTGNEIGNFFHHVFHGYQGYFEDYSVAFLSESMDVKTANDASSPVGFQWFRAIAEQRISDDENQSPATEVDTQFLCRVCNEGSNPCLYDGVCSEGTCECSLDSQGSLCEIPPVQNGHCDPFFNTPEFKMDGGDCCESTCISSDYVCGAEGEGYVSTGYFSCTLPVDEWQDYPLEGDAGSFSGFALDLSMRSVAVSELLQDRVRIYDKVGSAWVLRDTISHTPKSRFGAYLALSSGPYNVVSNPSFLAPLTVAAADGSRNLRIYTCNKDGCTLIQEIPLIYLFDLSDDGTVLAASVFRTDGMPPNVIRVYELRVGLFQAKTAISMEGGNNTMYGVLSLALNGNGDTLVFQKQRLEEDPFVGRVTREEHFEARVWDGTAYVQEAQFEYQANFNSYAYELSLDVSQDGSTVAYGVAECKYFKQLSMFQRNDNNTWVARTPPPFDATMCIESQRPKRNNNLALSADGSRVAFRLGVDVSVYTLESQEGGGQEWQALGERFDLTHYPVAMSSDGNELAIGSPQDGIGGISNVYSLPARKQCPSGTQLLRISVTLDRLPGDLYWDLRNNQTGEVLFQEGPYPADYAFGTIVEEVCVDTSSSCFEFSVYNRRNRGLQAPGQYALLLDGEDIGRGKFDGLFQKVSFGNCVTCPEGRDLFRLVVWTCGPAYWGLVEVVEVTGNTAANVTVAGLTTGSTDGMAIPDPTVYARCDSNQDLTCLNPLQLEYEACLDPGECYGVTVASPNRQLVYLELELGGVKKEANIIQVCSGASVFLGNPDKCLQEEF